MNPEQQKRGSDKGRLGQELEQLKHMLRQAIPPVTPNQLEAHVDLWPRLRTHLESQSTADRAAHSHREGERTRVPVPWFDWALAALAAAALLIFPGIIPALLYHF